ncbi:MAG: DUF6358 family protein [Sphingobacterium sp.]|uniref:DUF6358 family protein n=1 Tax=Sphingobacterium sp. JB170 TaxID=1434842 RepID=UPI00097ECCE9|nr:DUF6358 family protein [Sphingobacterium sp. JB170]SJN21335.1 hypothetical protein FM107_02780 [Sphingobacterium sp. JB170]
MTKYFILNIVLNFALAFVVYSGVVSYQLGNQTVLFIAIALLVVLVYLKVVMLKIVKKNASNNKPESNKPVKKGKR